MHKPIHRVLIVSAGDGHDRIDRRMALAAGAQEAVICRDGRSALRRLARDGADLVLCDWRLPDMDGCEFAHRLGQSAHGRNTPVVMLSTQDAESDVLEAVASGCMGYLIRPYSLEAFERQVAVARQAARRPDEVAAVLQRARALRERVRAEKFAEADLPDFANVRRHPVHGAYDEGVILRREGRDDEALERFARVLELNPAYAEAHEAVADILAGRGRRKLALASYRKAARHYAEQDRYLDVKTVFSAIRRLGGKAANPYLVRGVKSWRDGDRDDALVCLRRAAQLAPDCERVISRLARAYLETGNQEKARTLLADALGQNPRLNSAHTLLKRIKRQERDGIFLFNWFSHRFGALRKSAARTAA